MAFWSRKRSKGGWNGKLAARPPRWRGWGIAGNLLLLLGLWLAAVIFINLGGPQRYAGLAVGQRAPATVVAAVDFECVNVAATELLRRQASETVVPVFSIQMGPLQAAWRTLEKLANRAIATAARLRRTPPSESRQEFSGTGCRKADPRRWKPIWRSRPTCWAFRVSGETLARLFPPGQEMDALTALKESLSDVWMKGILSDVERESGFQGLSPNPIDRYPRAGGWG